MLLGGPPGRDSVHRRRHLGVRVVWELRTRREAIAGATEAHGARRHGQQLDGRQPLREQGDEPRLGGGRPGGRAPVAARENRGRRCAHVFRAGQRRPASGLRRPVAPPPRGARSRGPRRARSAALRGRGGGAAAPRARRGQALRQLAAGAGVPGRAEAFLGRPVRHAKTESRWHFWLATCVQNISASVNAGIAQILGELTLV
mmetsp:Transcript_2727/g.10685  ORF Transcript_2727/g.10685 Transcript_2727/m.10685 type:complete len:202 (+) Transcript_2727:1109-1714(+)